MALRQSATRSLRLASRNVAPSTRAFTVSALRQKELAADTSDFPNMRVRHSSYAIATGP
jgi:NADH dehydrogenase (ubiquinone) Fe-S protein 3